MVKIIDFIKQVIQIHFVKFILANQRRTLIDKASLCEVSINFLVSVHRQLDTQLFLRRNKPHSRRIQRGNSRT